MATNTPFSDNMLMLAVGGQLPAPLRGSGILLAPETGLIAVSRLPCLQAHEIEAVRSGPWSIGMLRGGMHATMVHFRFGEAGSRHGGEVGLSVEFAWGMAGPARRGDFPAEAMEADMAVTFVLADEDGAVVGLRHTALSRDDLAFFRADVQRQAKVRKIWSQEAQDRSFLREADRHGKLIPRSACPFWIDVVSLPENAAG